MALSCLTSKQAKYLKSIAFRPDVQCSREDHVSFQLSVWKRIDRNAVLSTSLYAIPISELKPLIIKDQTDLQQRLHCPALRIVDVRWSHKLGLLNPSMIIFYGYDLLKLYGCRNH